MATLPNPTAGMNPIGGAPAEGAAPSPAASPAAPPAQKLARLSMDAQAIASESPECAPMMREVQNQVRMAMMKMIQQRAMSQQATPPI